MAFARDKPVTRSRRSVADIGKITYNEKCHVHASQNRDVDETLAREVPPSDLARYFVGTLREWKGVPYVARSVPHAMPRGRAGSRARGASSNSSNSTVGLHQNRLIVVGGRGQDASFSQPS